MDTPSESVCDLCSSAGGELLWQGLLCRVVLVDDADYPGFCRVILSRHVSELTDLTWDESRLLYETVWNVERAVRFVLKSDKVNVASLGNVTPHVHWHVIPRFHNDRHFPRPIWAEPLRDRIELELPADLSAVLKDAVTRFQVP